MKSRSMIYRQCIVAFGVMLNIVGALIAVQLRLPIYLDSIGTLFISTFFGMKYGIFTGVMSGIVNGITFDMYSFYYIPVQVCLAGICAYVNKFHFFEKGHIFLSTFLISVPASMVGAIITVFVFKGFTSSGSMYMITILHHMGISLVMSSFLVQVVTDYIDKFIILLVIKEIQKRKILSC